MVDFDPTSALSVLAFVFCPAGVFSPDPEEAERVREIMRPIKARAARRSLRLTRVQ